MLFTLTKWLLWIWVALYLAALFLFVVGSFGLFGSDSGPLAGVFLVPLGLPWNGFVDLFPPALALTGMMTYPSAYPRKRVGVLDNLVGLFKPSL